MNSSAHSAVFDRQAALERMGFDEQLYEEMVRLLLEDCPRRLAELKTAIEAKNSESAKHASHSLKGLAANFSAAGAVRTAAAIERESLNGQWDQITEKFSQLMADFEDFLEAVRRDAVRASSPGTTGSRRPS